MLLLPFSEESIQELQGQISGLKNDIQQLGNERSELIAKVTSERIDLNINFLEND